MRRNKLWILILFIGLCLSGIAIIPTTMTEAQAGNLLEDPGFEYDGVWKTVVDARQEEGTFFSVAPAWNGWYTNSPSTADWMNRIPNGYPHTENGARFTRSGNRSQEINRGSATFTAAVYQTVTVEEGANVIGSAWVRMNLDLNANPVAQARVGIDTNGGTSPFESEIVWSAWAVDVLDINFRQLTVNATATGTQVTIWLYATQQNPSDPNGVYWDDASLTIGGSGGTAGGGVNAEGTPNTPAPPTQPPPAIAPFVNPQGAQDDGSIIHTVVTGDTLAAISVAYGVSMEEILDLNGLTSGRFLSVGQQLIIRTAQESTSDDDDSDNGDSDDTDTGDTDDDTDNDPAPPAETDEPDANVDSNDDDDEEDTEPTATRIAPTQPGDDNTSDDDTTDEDTTDDSSSEDDSADDPTPEPTNTPIPATSTPAPTAPVEVADTSNQVDPASSLGSVCVALFEDTNLNRVQNADELFLEGGQIDLRQADTTLSTYATDGISDPFCFDELDAGEYVAVASAPAGYGLTTNEQLRVNVLAGSTINVSFGAAEGVEQVELPEDSGTPLEQEVIADDDSDDDTDQLLQISGLIVLGLAGLTLISGIGMALFMRRR